MILQRAQPYQEFYLKLGETRPFGIDWEDFLSIRWLAGRLAAASELIRPSQATGFQYICSTPGYTGDFEPPWPTASGGTVQDGAAVWTAQPVTTSSLIATVSASSWAADSASGFILTGSSFAGQQTQIIVNAAAANAPGDYNVVNTITLSDGSTRMGTWRLKVRP